MNHNTSDIKSSLAGPFKRFFAFIIDLFLLLILFLVLDLEFVISASWNYVSGAGLVSSVAYAQPLNAVFLIVVLMVYFSLTEGLWGMSLGKLIFKIKVVTLKKEKISFANAVLRNIVTPLDLIVGPIFFLFSTKNQTLGDKLAHTVVIRKKLADLPAADLPVSILRKLVASLFVLSAVSFFILTLWTIPKVSHFNQLSQDAIEVIKSKSTTDTKNLYDDYFSDEFKEEIPFEQFEQIFNAPEFVDALKNVQTNQMVLNHWEFNKQQAIISGKLAKDSEDGLRLQFVTNEEGQWKLLGFRILPAAENLLP